METDEAEPAGSHSELEVEELTWAEPALPNTRRGARQLAVQALYWETCSPGDVDSALSELACRHGVSGLTYEFAEQLVRTALERAVELDSIIDSTAAHWRTDRIARIDGIIIRLALTEILYFADIPPSVTIDEAVELAKAYGGQQSYAFVNGVLDAVVTSRDPDEKKP